MQALSVAKTVYNDILKAIKATERELEGLDKEFQASTGVSQIDRRIALRERLKDLKHYEKDAKKQLAESEEAAAETASAFKEAKHTYIATVKELESELLRYADEIARYCAEWKNKAGEEFVALNEANKARNRAAGIAANAGEDSPSAEVEYQVKRLWERILFGA